jgi:hypothetical protein
VRCIEEKEFLIQTNHYDLESSPFTEHNEEPYAQDMSEKQWFDSELLNNSQKRHLILTKALQEDADTSMQERLINLYKEVPVLNYETAQWVLMKPKSGKIDVYSCVDK